MLYFRFQPEENDRYSRRITKNRFCSSRSYKRQHICAQAAELMDEPDLFLKLYPDKAFEPTQETPDFEMIHKELLRSGVTLRILWDVYRDIYCKFSSLHKIFYSL